MALDKLQELEAERDVIAAKLRGLKEDVSQSEGFDDENRTKWDDLTDQYEKCEVEVEKVRADAERLAKLDSMKRTRPTTDSHNPDPMAPITREEQADAMRGWMLDGTKAQRPEYRAAAEKAGIGMGNTMALRFNRGPAPKTQADIADMRAQSVATTTAGGHFVNPAGIMAYEQSLLAFGGVRSISTVFRTETGADLLVPTCSDHGNIGVLVTENVAITEQDVTLSNITLGAYMFSSKLVRCSYQFLNDAFLNVDSWLFGLLGERIARAQSAYFTTGTGTAQPNGYVTGAGDSGVTLASATAVTYLEMVEALHSLDPAYRMNSTWTFGDVWLKYMRKILDGNSLPIWNPGMTGGPPSTILDRPYMVNQQMPTATSTKVITIGDMSKFWIRDINQEFALVKLVERYAEYGQVAFSIWQRSDSDLIDAGTDPIKYVTAG